MKKTKNMFNSKICRVCLKSCDDSLHIFGEYYLQNYKKLKECLEEICDISVSPDDNFPEYICLKCTKLLEQCCNFRILARKNDCLLHKILRRKCKQENYGILYESEDHFKDNIQISRSESIDKEENYSEDLGLINSGSLEQANNHENCSNIIEEVDLAPKEDPEDQFYTFDNEDYIEVEYDISTNEKVQEPQDIKQEEDEDEDENEIFDTEKKEKPGKFECKFCGRNFVYLKNKNNHEDKRSKGSKQQCHICQKKFCTIDDLMKHIFGHTNEKSFGCDTCERRYYTQRELTRHLKTHSDIKNFKCTYCGKAFHERGILNNHIRRVHFNERKHQCNICGKFFQTPSKVRTHQKSKICSETKAIKTLHDGEGEFAGRMRPTRNKVTPQRVSVKRKKSRSQFKSLKTQKSAANS